MLNNSQVQYGYYLMNKMPPLQLKEMMGHYHLKKNINPFKLCMDCNRQIIKIDKNHYVVKCISGIFVYL